MGSRREAEGQVALLLMGAGHLVTTEPEQTRCSRTPLTFLLLRFAFMPASPWS